MIMTAMAAGKSEKMSHIICCTDSSLVMVMTVCPVVGSVPDTNPAMPRSRATSEALMAVPNFCDIVPEEKMTPVEDVPFFSVA